MSKKPWICGDCKRGAHWGHDGSDNSCNSISKIVVSDGARYATLCNCKEGVIPKKTVGKSGEVILRFERPLFKAKTCSWCVKGDHTHHRALDGQCGASVEWKVMNGLIYSALCACKHFKSETNNKICPGCQAGEHKHHSLWGNGYRECTEPVKELSYEGVTYLILCGCPYREGDGIATQLGKYEYKNK